MRRFQFRLEAVLTQRRAVEDKRLAAYAELQREMNAISSDLQAIREDYDITVGREPIGGLDGMALRERYLDVLALRKAQTERVRDAVTVQLDKSRELLVAARRDRKALEKLREEQYAHWVEEGLKTEQNYLDELAVMRHPRALAGGQ